MSLSTNTMIPLTEFSQIIQTNSSPETIVALLNERERYYSSLLKTLHKNTKYVFPYWKVCEGCKEPLETLNATQAIRNRFCEPCLHQKRTNKRPHTVKPLSERKLTSLICPECGKEFYIPTCYVNSAKEHRCSRECNGKARGREWAAQGYKGALSRTPESFKAAARYGENNHFWKDGITYRNRKGHYSNQSIKYVRCPQEYIEMSRKDGYVMEHRLLVAQAIGRVLLRREVVHHANHNAEDNRLENLELFATNGDHKMYEKRGYPLPIWRLLPQPTIQE